MKITQSNFSAITKFNHQLNSLVEKLRKHAENQMLYDLEVNIPGKIGGINHENVVSHALKRGLISTISELNQWSTTETIEFAADLLEDVNAHTEAAELRKSLDAE